MRIKITILILLLLTVTQNFAHAKEFDEKQNSNVAALKTENEEAYLNFLYGSPVKDGLILLPFGFHTKSGSTGNNNNDLFGITIRSISFGTFVNSFDDRTWFLTAIRNAYSFQDFGINYIVGVTYGYKGKLSRQGGNPLSDTFLFRGNLNPVIAINPYYEITEKLQLQLMITPLAIVSGIKYSF